MWFDKRDNAKGHENYPGVLEALQDALAQLNGAWVMEATIARNSGTQTFYMLAADREVSWEEIELEDGLSVICAMRYGEEGAEDEDECDVAVVFQNDEGENHEKELELITTMLYALVEEKAFPNARMALYVRDLLRVDDVQKYLADSNYPAYIRSRAYQMS